MDFYYKHTSNRVYTLYVYVYIYLCMYIHMFRT